MLMALPGASLPDHEVPRKMRHFRWPDKRPTYPALGEGTVIRRAMRGEPHMDLLALGTQRVARG
jgi:hypothetical protein